MDTHSAVPSPVTGGKAPLSWRAPGRREKERERMVTEKANYHKYALNRRRPSPDRLKIKGKMKTQSRFTEDSAESGLMALGQHGCASGWPRHRSPPRPTHQALPRAKLGIRGGGNIRTSTLSSRRPAGLRPHRTATAHCKRTPESHPQPHAL